MFILWFSNLSLKVEYDNLYYKTDMLYNISHLFIDYSEDIQAKLIESHKKGLTSESARR